MNSYPELPEKTPEHDKLQLWCVKACLEIARAMARQINYVVGRYALRVDEVHKCEATLEHTLQLQYYSATYHLDVLLKCHAGLIGERDKHYNEMIEMGLECKPRIYSFGDTLRQVRRYQKWGAPNMMAIVSPDTRFEADFRQQKVAFINPDLFPSWTGVPVQQPLFFPKT